MAKLKFTGPFSNRISSFLTLNRIGLSVALRHAFGHKIAPDWDVGIETGIRFWRHQFTKAMTHRSIAEGRAVFDSLRTDTDDVYDVTCENTDSPAGAWIMPAKQLSDAVLLYLHGGGYTFNGPISDRFGAMLAHHTGAKIFMPAYRLTPEHPHPAQADDALAAWQYVTARAPAERIVVIGDSAGGHMSLMLLQALKSADERQPALCIGLCPWTDTGARGASLHDNDPFDMVQGWMALRFGEWLDPDGTFGREDLSPVSHSFAGLAPLYLQAGGREILRDMIFDFADIQAGHGADIMLDVWNDMPHDFQVYDSLMQSSSQALGRISDAVEHFAGKGSLGFHASGTTRTARGVFAPVTDRDQPSLP